MHYDDGAYGVHMLYPKGDIIQGSKGLQRNIAVTFEKHERLLFGILPLYDLLYSLSAKVVGESQGANVIFWNLIFLLISLFSIYILIRRITVVR